MITVGFVDVSYFQLYRELLILNDIHNLTPLGHTMPAYSGQGRLPGTVVSGFLLDEFNMNSHLVMVKIL